MAVLELPVVRFDQKPGLCGAATAQMILFYKNRIGNQAADQDTLWGQIQAHTGGSRPGAPAQIKAHDCPQWALQQCDKCAGAREFTCWCTYPPALEATLALYNLPLVLSTPASDQIATARVIDSVDFDIPPAVLVKNGLHWIAVAGYETGGALAQAINGRLISEIYICDPAVGGAANHSVAIDTWMQEYSSPVIQCGTYLNQLVVIAATAPAPVIGGPAPGTPTNVTIVETIPLITVAWPKRPKKPKKPKRPPKKPHRRPRKPETPSALWKKTPKTARKRR